MPILRGLSAYIALGVAVCLLGFVIPAHDRWILYALFGGGLAVLHLTIGREP